MIVLCTDFGVGGPYVGQMRAVVARLAPKVPIIELFSDLVPFNPRAAAYLLAAYATEFPAGSVFLGVVDPGVGTARGPVVIRASGRWFVGPDNGLWAVTAHRMDPSPRWWDITWRPPSMSASFHGRDLFAPVAARLANGGGVPGTVRRHGTGVGSDWPDEVAEVVYIDPYGNAITGLKVASLTPNATLALKGRCLKRANTFADVPAGAPMWYENANGLAEIAVNQGRADELLGLGVGDVVEPVTPAD